MSRNTPEPIYTIDGDGLDPVSSTVRAYIRDRLNRMGLRELANEQGAVMEIVDAAMNALEDIGIVEAGMRERGQQGEHEAEADHQDQHAAEKAAHRVEHEHEHTHPHGAQEHRRRPEGT